MRWSDLDQSVQSEREELEETHRVDITTFPVVAVVKTPANTVHHLQVTGWRLGKEAIELIVGEESNAPSETPQQQFDREQEEYKAAVEQVSGIHPSQRGQVPQEGTSTPE